MRIKKAPCVLILGIFGHMTVNWHTSKQKKTKKRQFLAWKFIISPIAKKPLKFGHNVGDYKWLMYTELGCTRSRG